MGLNLARIMPIIEKQRAVDVLVPDMSYKSQGDQRNICWAACQVMIVNHFAGTDLDPCELMSDLLPCRCRNCCVTKFFEGCDVSRRESSIESTYNDYFRLPVDCEMSTISPTATLSASLSFIKSEIDARRPVEVLYRLDEGGSHVVLVVGYTPASVATNLMDIRFLVFDPITTVKHISAQDLRSLETAGVWATIWHSFKKKIENGNLKASAAGGTTA